MVMQNLREGGGGGAVNKLHYMVYMKVVNGQILPSSPWGEGIPYNGLQGRLGLRGIPFIGLRYIDSRAVKG